MPPTSSVNPDISFQFPQELELKIFATVAVMYPEFIPTLLRVARRFLLEHLVLNDFRLEPMLYTTVQVLGLDQKHTADVAILRAIETKPADFFPKAVRHMFLWAISWSPREDHWTGAELEKLIRACSGVVNLVVAGSWEIFRPMLSDMRPHHLRMVVHAEMHLVDFSLPFFQNVSHLQLSDGIWGKAIPVFPQLQPLRQLTHLAIAHPDFSTSILEDYPQLEVLVVYLRFDLEAIEFAERWVLGDPRVVILADHFMEDWFCGIRGHKDMWTRAEEFLLRRRNGEVEGSSVFIINMTQSQTFSASCYYLAPAKIPSDVMRVLERWQ
ncbi:hypothetical protein B0H13DRAFT_1631546 [Mycena leptocephala]|nr:hypothetical protein B0H13DRAFT_1631546 [Mycena leptocephala]